MGMRVALAVVCGVVAWTPTSADEPSGGPAWGRETGGLRLGISLVQSAEPESPALVIVFQNAGPSDLRVNLGIQAGKMEPTGIRLCVRRTDGSVAIYNWREPLRIGGRVVDFLVSLRAGDSYVLHADVSDFKRGKTPLEPGHQPSPPWEALRLPPGKNVVSVLFEGHDARFLDNGLEGLAVFDYWRGTAESGSVVVEVPGQ